HTHTNRQIHTHGDTLLLTHCPITAAHREIAPSLNTFRQSPFFLQLQSLLKTRKKYHLKPRAMTHSHTHTHAHSIHTHNFTVYFSPSVFFSPSHRWFVMLI